MIKQTGYMPELLKSYEDYLDGLIKSNKPGELFTNGGIEHASILMSKLFSQTKNEVRMFCEGFKPNLITTEPYYTSLRKYIESEDGKSIKVLVETDEYINEESFRYLQTQQKEKEKDGKENLVQIRKIKPENKEKIFKEMNTEHYNFSVFDESMFRLEYDPDKYKAIGSFNDPERAKILKKLFDLLFEEADLMPNTIILQNQ